MTDYVCCYRCGLHPLPGELSAAGRPAGPCRKCGSTSFVRNNCPGQEHGRFEIDPPAGPPPARVRFREFL